jgi:hypothetical protein
MPKEMDIAYFVHLHLNTIKSTTEPSHREGHCCYRVEGKPRPMLVLTVLPEERGCRWFRVLAITSKGKDVQGKLKRGFIPIGKLRDHDCVSYITVDDNRKLPENMVHRANRRSPIIDSMDRLGFDNVITTVARLSMRAK